MQYNLKVSTVVTNAVVYSLRINTIYLFGTYRISECIVKCTVDTVLLQYSHNKCPLFSHLIVSIRWWLFCYDIILTYTYISSRLLLVEQPFAHNIVIS